MTSQKTARNRSFSGTEWLRLQKLEQESRTWGYTLTSVLCGTSDLPVDLSQHYLNEVQEHIFQDMWHELLHVITGELDVIEINFCLSLVTSHKSCLEPPSSEYSTRSVCCPYAHAQNQ